MFFFIVVSNEPKTYANLLKQGTTGISSFSTSTMATSPNQMSKPAVSPPPVIRSENRDTSLTGPPLGQPPLNQRNMSNRGARSNNTGGRNVTRQDSRGLNRTGFNEDNGKIKQSFSKLMYVYLFWYL